MAASARFELAQCHSQSVVPYRLATRQSNTKLKSGGERWSRTIEPEGTDLQSAAFDHFATPPKNGAESRNRTRNLLITSQLRYQLRHFGIYGGRYRTRTYDPLLVRQVL